MRQAGQQAPGTGEPVGAPQSLFQFGVQTLDLFVRLAAFADIADGGRNQHALG